jgi:hypothetical protein|tara:strand:+ start:525 stop:713 length:189 start_codon:yes stop_codon:yes gene_type:complete
MKKLENGTKITGPFDIEDAPVSKKLKKDLAHLNSLKQFKITVFDDDTDEIFHVNKKNKKVDI